MGGYRTHAQEQFQNQVINIAHTDDEDEPDYDSELDPNEQDDGEYSEEEGNQHP